MNELQVMDNGMLVAVDFNVSQLTETETSIMTLFVPGHEPSPEEQYNAMQNPTKTVGDNIGDVFNLTGVLAHSVNVVDKNTGEIIPAPRLILFGEDGESYSSVSKTLFNSVKNMFAILGTPDMWDSDGKKIKLTQSNKDQKRFFSVALVKEKAEKK